MVRVGVARGARLFHLVCLVPQIMIHYPRWNVRNVHKAKQTQIYHRHGKPEASFPPLATFLHLPLPPLFHYLSLFSPFTTPPSWVSDTQDIVFACAVVYKQDVAAIGRNPICSGLCSSRHTTRANGTTHTQIHTNTYPYCS